MQKEKHPFILFSIILGCFILAGCMGKQQPGSQEKQDSTVQNSELSNADTTKNDYQIKIFKNAAPLSGFGYDIYLKGNIYIHQPNIPAVPGNNGFSTENAADNTARLVLHKIKNNIMPPSIDLKELDSIGVLK